MLLLYNLYGVLRIRSSSLVMWLLNLYLHKIQYNCILQISNELLLLWSISS